MISTPIVLDIQKLLTTIGNHYQSKYLHIVLNERNQFTVIPSELDERNYRPHFNDYIKSIPGRAKDLYVMAVRPSGRFGDELRQSGIDFSAYPNFNMLRRYLLEQEEKWNNATLLSQGTDMGHLPRLAFLKRKRDTEIIHFQERCAKAKIGLIFDGVRGSSYNRPVQHYSYPPKIVQDQDSLIGRVPKHLEDFKDLFEAPEYRDNMVMCVFFNTNTHDFFWAQCNSPFEARDKIDTIERNSTNKAILVLRRDTGQSFADQIKQRYINPYHAVKCPIITPGALADKPTVPLNLSWMERPEPGSWR